MTGAGMVADRRWVRGGSGTASRHLVLLPHAGAGASAFFSWLAARDHDVEHYAVQYPGRGSRLDEEPPASIPELARDTLITLDRVGAGPVVLLGHSMGGLVALETAHLLSRDGRPPAALVVTGCAPPHTPRTDLPDTFDDDALADWLRHSGGTAAEVLDEPQLLRLILPALRADLAAIVGYRPAARPPLTCPIIAMAGTGERTLDRATLAGWREYTTGPCHLHAYRGGHFALYQQRDRVLNLVRTLVGTGPADRPATETDHG
ncbi:thioesterase II family protein [Micromonospora cathayae]|uniref:Alpha/beta fold hydrolase n=1 Tax=Micromonospora cathayae TaxID=3028804 RepID=A0ABY7ZTU9_9ACTN|nr:alpha/beta fold hydrolase [Micromonospora sp. HUAS 3]WDZ85826.1 alpha/beta fold hydrolase [Micromonospora sp. HUAS 3]